MIYLHAIFIPDYQFQSIFYVSLGNIFLLFLWRTPLVVVALGSCPVCPLPLNPTLCVLLADLIVCNRVSVDTSALLSLLSCSDIDASISERTALSLALSLANSPR